VLPQGGLVFREPPQADRRRGRRSSGTGPLISPEMAQEFRARYQDSPEHVELLEHALRWNESLHETPEGWTSSSATAYRMALEYSLEILLGQH
jgi:hypothetical protein